MAMAVFFFFFFLWPCIELGQNNIFIALESIYILLYRPSLCKQNPKRSLTLFGYISCFTLGLFLIFSPHAIIFIFNPFLFNIFCIVFKQLLKVASWQISYKRTLPMSINSPIWHILLLYIYIYIYIYINWLFSLHGSCRVAWTGPLAWWLAFEIVRENWVQSRSILIKDSKNGTWC